MTKTLRPSKLEISYREQIRKIDSRISAYNDQIKSITDSIAGILEVRDQLARELVNINQTRKAES